jgi:hypothetical protein
VATNLAVMIFNADDNNVVTSFNPIQDVTTTMTINTMLLLLRIILALNIVLLCLMEFLLPPLLILVYRHHSLMVLAILYLATSNILHIFTNNLILDKLILDLV